MGRVTDGSANIYGKGIDQTDVAKYNRINNPNGSHTTLGVLGATLLPQLMSGIICYAADGAFGGGSGNSNLKSKDNADSDKTAADVAQAGINKILTENNCQTIEDLSLSLQLAQNEAPALDTKVAGLTSDLKVLTDAQSARSTRISELKGLLAGFNPKDIEIDIFRDEATRTQYHALKDEYDALVREFQAQTPIIEAKQRELEEAQRAKAANTQKIATLTKAVADVEEYVKQLKKANGTEVIEQYKNPEAQEILQLFKKLSVEKNSEKRYQYARQLQSAVETYYSKHKEGESPTIDNLPAAKSYLSIKNFKPDTTALDEQVASLGLGFAPRKLS